MQGIVNVNGFMIGKRVDTSTKLQVQYLYVGYLHSLAVRNGIGKKLLVRELARELVFFSIPKYKFSHSREVNERLLESDSSRAIEN